MHHLGEAQIPAVEADGRIDVVDDIANAHGSHYLNLLPWPWHVHFAFVRECEAG
jgi:hypothetical protein